MTVERFPFGAQSSPRPPRLPTDGDALLSVVGVYPSALHVRWDLPRWAVQELGLPPRVGALAVDVEPTVFWDGTQPDPRGLVSAWQRQVGFRPGDDRGEHGRVREVMNGTSGQAVAERVLGPLGVPAGRAFFTDVLTRFFVKSGSTKRPQQADRIRDVYEPFAEEAALPVAALPFRPAPGRLVEDASQLERGRLRQELSDAAAPTVVTLGEEARAVIQRVADDVTGPPTVPLRRDDPHYGQPGPLRIGRYEARWHALTHPGNRSPQWAALHGRWAERVGA